MTNVSFDPFPHDAAKFFAKVTLMVLLLTACMYN